ncbi:MAG: DoxX family membrane protein [Cyanobacteria bacterium J06627_28]
MIKNLLHWMDHGEQSSGFPPLLQAAGGIHDIGVGIAIIAGFLTSVADLGLAGMMAIALILYFSQGTPFVKATPDASGES